MDRKVKYKKPTHLIAKKIQTRDVHQDITKLIYPRGEAIAQVGSKGTGDTRCGSLLAELRARIPLGLAHGIIVSF